MQPTEINKPNKSNLTPNLTKIKHIKSKGNFLDFIDDASMNHQLIRDLIDEAYKNDETVNDLLTFFHSKHYLEVTISDCSKLLSASDAGVPPCNFAGNQY